MFTGIVKAVGKVHSVGKGLLVEGCEPFSPLQLGESIAVDGVCLTVSNFAPGGFLADVSEETLKRTTLGKKALQGAMVNLEPALLLSDRIGGHLVSGHIDGLGEIVAIKELSNSWYLEVCWQDISFCRYVCQKGSICVDGISLTVADLSDQDGGFWIAVIPHTWRNTALRNLSVGSLVNLEADLIAKYAERLLKLNQSNSSVGKDSEITRSWLAGHGWI